MSLKHTCGVYESSVYEPCPHYSYYYMHTDDLTGTIPRGRVLLPSLGSYCLIWTSSTQSAGNQPVRPFTVPSQNPPSPMERTANTPNSHYHTHTRLSVMRCYECVRYADVKTLWIHRNRSDSNASPVCNKLKLIQLITDIFIFMEVKL